jgi:hypothetical protein
MLRNFPFTGFIIGLLFLAAPAWAMPLEFMTTTVDQTTQTVHFDMHFVGTPDFFTVDSAGRQADSFQLFISDTGGESLVRVTGDEIHDGGAVVVRAFFPTLDGYSIRENDPVT